jgi:oligopeptide transport system ATP-binding protein
MPYLMQIKNISKYFPIRSGLLQKVKNHVHAVDEINLDIEEGETLSIVGESGCGKTTLGRTLVKLYKPTKGTIYFKEQNITAMSNKQMLPLRKQIQMIFQDPYASLNPRMSVKQILQEPFKIHTKNNFKDTEKQIKELIELVGLDETALNRYPHEFSGGQRQRISIARTLSLKPSLIIADEPVSALDVSIQSQILNLLMELQESLKLTYIFISHDLSVVRYISKRVAVMYLGKIVELASRDQLFQNPKHPYTQALLASVPKTTPHPHTKKKTITGDIPSPSNPPSGCHFHTRCPFVMKKCKTIVPQLIADKHNQSTACHLYNGD